MYFVSSLHSLVHLMETFINFLETLISDGVRFLDASKAAEACGAMLGKKAKNASKSAALKTWPQCIVSHS